MQPVMPYYGDDYDEYYDSDYYVPDDYYGYDDSDLQTDYYGENDWSKTFGFVLIILLGYILPLAMIIVSLIAYSKSKMCIRDSYYIVLGICVLVIGAASFLSYKSIQLSLIHISSFSDIM